MAENTQKMCVSGCNRANEPQGACVAAKSNDAKLGPFTSSSIRCVDERDLILLESAITAIEEAAAAVAAEVERDRLTESSLARLSTVEAELRRSRLALEKIIQEETT